MQRDECKTTEGGGPEDQCLIGRLFVAPTLFSLRGGAGLGDPHDTQSSSAVPLESLGVSDAVRSEDQRIQTGASRAWEAIAAVFCGHTERPLQGRLEAAANRAAAHEIEGEGCLQVDGGTSLPVNAHA